MRSGNPFLGDNTFEIDDRGEAKMTLMGTVNKTAILLALTLISALWVWNKYFELQDPAAILPLMWIGIIGGLVLAFVPSWPKRWLPIQPPAMRCSKGWRWAGSRPSMKPAIRASSSRPSA